MLRFNNGDCFGIRILVVLPVTPEPELDPAVRSPDNVQLGDISGGEKSVGLLGHGGWLTYVFSWATPCDRDTCNIPKLVSGQLSESGVLGRGPSLHLLSVQTMPQAITRSPTTEINTITTKLKSQDSKMVQFLYCQSKKFPTNID